jgi:RimJ/RimL family protein N-acetyltransferase
MSECLTAILDYGFSVLELLKVEAHTYSHNVPARHLLEKLRFELENTSADSAYYSLPRASWSTWVG